MSAERLELTGVDRIRYFVPTAICIYLAALCAVLIVTSAFLVDRAGWRILVQDPPRRLDAQTLGAILNIGERVVVQFRDHDVLIASICDPSIGFSLAGRRHCAGHREFVRQVVVPIPR
jgi:hypothetical protein